MSGIAGRTWSSVLAGRRTEVVSGGSVRRLPSSPPARGERGREDVSEVTARDPGSPDGRGRGERLAPIDEQGCGRDLKLWVGWAPDRSGLAPDRGGFGGSVRCLPSSWWLGRC